MVSREKKLFIREMKWVEIEKKWVEKEKKCVGGETKSVEIGPRKKKKWMAREKTLVSRRKKWAVIKCLILQRLRYRSLGNSLTFKKPLKTQCQMSISPPLQPIPR